MKIKILVVGQTPPPFGGQAMMIERLVKATFSTVEIVHVRMSFSDSFKSVGTFGLKKIMHLFSLIVRILYARFSENVNILYYPPAGPNKNPFFRDLVILAFTRILFNKTIYHFRAAGISEFIASQPRFIRKIALMIYGNPTAAIQLSLHNPADAKYFNAKLKFIIKNGLEDSALEYLPITRRQDKKIRLLYAGVINETKGILDLLCTAKLLRNRSVNFELICMGDFASHEFQEVVESTVKKYELSDCISFPGVKTDKGKWEEFLRADIFCFPTFFESESFGNVVVEAMMFELPVVATRWRGVSDIVVDNETGYLVTIHDTFELANRIEILAKNPELRKRMGYMGRTRFLSEFLIESHLTEMERAFIQVAQTP